jgi:hypothetical protein
VQDFPATVFVDEKAILLSISLGLFIATRAALREVITRKAASNSRITPAPSGTKTTSRSADRLAAVRK